VYKDDVEEGQTAKLSATNNFAFTQPCITVTSVLKRRSDRTFTTTRARNKAAARNEIWDTKNLGKRDFVAIIYNGLKKRVTEFTSETVEVKKPLDIQQNFQRPLYTNNGA
jgi:hypothetical protein